MAIAMTKAGDKLVVEGYPDVCVKGQGVRVEVHPNGIIDVYGEARVQFHHGADPASAPVAEPQVGDAMPDGTVYAGISPDSGRPMYAAAADAPLTMKWKEAMEYAAALDAQGHKDWRVPTGGELDALFNNRAAIGGFNETGSHPAGWYWSSTEDRYDADSAWDQRFSDGNRDWHRKSHESSLRLVRS